MNELSRRILGRTGLSVTVLGFGAMDIGGPPAAAEMSDADAERLLNAVLDEGINFIDTAVCYGRSEERIGRAIAHRRSEYFIATKCGCIPGQGMGVQHRYDAANVRAGVEHSLRTMRTDVIDLVQFHTSLAPREWQDDGALQALQVLQAEGKVRFIGISGVLPNLREQVAAGVFDVYQVPYSALQREHEFVIDQAAAGFNPEAVLKAMVASGWTEDVALAALESLVHLNPPVVFTYAAIPIEFDAALVEKFTALPPGWTGSPAPPSTRAIGDLWAREARSAVLELPSVIIPGESNYLLNPAHPAFKKIVIGKAEPFSFDPRLL